MKKAMFSQPMNGLSDEEIIKTREKAITYLESQGYEVVNTFFTDEWYSKENMAKRGVVNIPMCFMAKSIENMCLCDAVYFAKCSRRLKQEFLLKKEKNFLKYLKRLLIVIE